MSAVGSPRHALTQPLLPNNHNPEDVLTSWQQFRHRIPEFPLMNLWMARFVRNREITEADLKDLYRFYQSKIPGTDLHRIDTQYSESLYSPAHFCELEEAINDRNFFHIWPMFEKALKLQGFTFQKPTTLEKMKQFWIEHKGKLNFVAQQITAFNFVNLPLTMIPKQVSSLFYPVLSIIRIANTSITSISNEFPNNNQSILLHVRDNNTDLKVHNRKFCIIIPPKNKRSAFDI